jgi:hypothetical protein
MHFAIKSFREHLQDMGSQHTIQTHDVNILNYLHIYLNHNDEFRDIIRIFVVCSLLFLNFNSALYVKYIIRVSCLSTLAFSACKTICGVRGASPKRQNSYVTHDLFAGPPPVKHWATTARVQSWRVPDVRPESVANEKQRQRYVVS